MRHYQNKFIIVIIVAVSTAVFVINSLITSLQSIPPAASVTATAARATMIQSVNSSTSVLHSLSATFVRIDSTNHTAAASPALPRIVLSIDVINYAFNTFDPLHIFNVLVFCEGVHGKADE